MRQMPHVVLVGAPNAGKSSLFNALLTRNRAIVSPVAGTTRDSVSAPLRINAHDILLVDTAGEGDTDDPLADLVDVQRARTHAGADIRLVCVPAVTDAEASAAIMRAEEESAFDVPQIVVRTKSDLLPGFEPEPGAIAISLHAGDVGLLLDRLRSAISTALEQRRFQDQRRANYAANVRVANSLRETNRALTDAMKTLTNKSGHELVAVSLREAIAHLGEITGAVYTDDLLDKVFSRFCIGK